MTQVHLAGGITGQTLAYTSQQFGSWSIVYWILPVKSGTSTSYERVVLYIQNRHGLVTESGPGTGATSGQLAGTRSAGSTQNVLVSNRDFLVAYAREMIDDQATQSAAVLASHNVA